MNKFKLGVIGCGFMAQAILDGVLQSSVLSPKEIIVSDPDHDKTNRYREKGCAVAVNNVEAASDSEYLLFAVKPQQLNSVLEELKKCDPKNIISILAGTKKFAYSRYFPFARVTRCMPNTPCSLGKGAIGIDADDFSEEGRTFVLSVFSVLGQVVSLSEEKLNAVTAISGSGPAYVYLFAKAMTEAGVAAGLTMEEARKLTEATIIGGGEMMKKNSDSSLDELIQAVCSKGGTTIAAIDSFRENHFEEVIADGIRAAIIRSKELEDMK